MPTITTRSVTLRRAARIAARHVITRGLPGRVRASREITHPTIVFRRHVITRRERLAQILLPWGARAEFDRLTAAYRRCRHPRTRRTMPLRERLELHRIRKILREVERRGLTVPAGHEAARYSIIDRRHDATLIAGSWWHEYTRQEKWQVAAAYVGGVDDGGPWAIRVPHNCQSVARALTWAVPADARKRVAAGAQHRRQGDILFVRAPSGEGVTDVNGRLEMSRHTVRQRADGGYSVLHPSHRCVRLPRGAWRAYGLRQDSGARGRGCGD